MQDSNHSNVPFFNNVYAWGDNELFIKRVYAKYADRLKNFTNVLDIGCGNGYFLDLLKERGIQAIGIDNDPVLINNCQERNLQVIQMDAIDYLRNTNSWFGGIFCGCLIEHLDAERAEELIRECSRVIKSSGLLIITTDNPAVWRSHADWFWRDLTHRRLYPLSLLRALFVHYGFRVVDANPDYELSTEPIRPQNKILRFLRRILLGKELFNAIYDPGSIYIIGQKQ
jgi:SAM-dependent methyltransferase